MRANPLRFEERSMDGCLLSEFEGFRFDLNGALRVDGFQASWFLFDITGRNPSTSIGGGCPKKGFD